MKVWVITDTHFNHKNMVTYENRPEDFNDLIIANWQRLVANQDRVVHLGDVILGRDSELEALMAYLPGHIVLTLGNHDSHSESWYMNRWFDFACTRFVYQGILFSHEPVIPLPTDVKLNIHGHFHRKPICFEQLEDTRYYMANRSKYHMVQIEDTLAPIELKTLLQEARS